MGEAPPMPFASGPKPAPQLQVQRVMRSLSSTQATVQRSLATTRELDERFIEAQKRADNSAITFLYSEPDAVDADRLRQVRAEQRSAIIIAEKKVQLVVDAHDQVDRQIEKLDVALAHLQERYGPLPIGPVGAPDVRSSTVRGDGTVQLGCGDDACRARCLSSGTAPNGATTSPQLCFGSVANGGHAGASAVMLDSDMEETYCSCGRVSFGEMVCCDNPACALEWFHFGCVGLEESPPGMWLCPVCMLLQNSGLKSVKRFAIQHGHDGASNNDAHGAFDDARGHRRERGRGGGRGRGRVHHHGSPAAGALSVEAGEDASVSRALASLVPLAPLPNKLSGSRGGRGSRSSGRGGRGSGRRGCGRGRIDGRGQSVSAAMSSVLHNIFPGGHKSKHGNSKHPIKDCPACRGKHKAHTCGRGRNAMLARLAAGE